MSIDAIILDKLQRNDSSLIYLDLSQRQIRINDVMLLLRSLKNNNRLISLNLSNNFIDDEAAFLLAKKLQIPQLDISNNIITDKGIQAFLQNKHLNKLNIQGNKYNFLTLKKLDKTIKNNFQKIIKNLAIILSVIAQGRGQIESPFHFLPTEILFHIMSYLKPADFSPFSLYKMSKIILDNIDYDDEGKKLFHWKKPTDSIFAYPRFYPISIHKEENNETNELRLSRSL